MKWNKSLWLLFALLCLTVGFLLIAANCGDDDDDDDDGAPPEEDDDSADDDTADDDAADDDATDDDATDDDATDDDETDDDDDVAEDPTEEPVVAHFVDFVSGNDIKGATCELVRNADGGSFDPPITTTSDDEGYCRFNTTKEKGDLFSIKFMKDQYVTTYLFHYQTDESWRFAMVNNIIRLGIFAALGLTQDDSKGAIVGGVKWIDNVSNPDDWTFEDVGCATVTSSGGDTFYYMDDTGLPSTERSNTNPNDGYFLALLVDPGAYTLTANTDGNEETADMPMVFADAISYVNINYWIDDYPTNPEPGGCTK